MTVVEPDLPEFHRLVAPDATLTKIGSGYVFTEGPAWSVAEQCLYFSDIPDDKRFRWSESTGMELIMDPTFKGNGMAFDIEGRLIVCEHVSSSVTRFHADGFHETVCFHHKGVYLNSPNDLVGEQPGRKHLLHRSRLRTVERLDRPSVSRFSASRVSSACLTTAARRNWSSTPTSSSSPNGLCFSPDESLMYVNDSPRAEVKVFDVADDGMLVNGRVLRTRWAGGTIAEGSVDGMECDEFGNIWVTSPGGIWVLTPEGERLGIIRTPEVCGSMCWGGPDLRTLFLTTSTTVHTMPVLCTSAPLPHYDLGEIRS